MKKYLILIFSLFFTTLWSQDLKKVLIIGIDGCRSDALEIASTPTIDSLINEGIFSPDALNDDITMSGPGWSANLCGVWSNKHQVTNNDFSSNNYDQYPPFISYVEEFNSTLNTASICHWDPINDFIISDHADYKLNLSSDADVSSQASLYITQNDPDVIFLHFDDVDHAGHASGFSPTEPEYIIAIENVDALITPIIQAIETRPNYDNEDWLILVTTDHGGINTSHGGNSMQEQNIFFIASGKNIDTQLVEKEIIIIEPPIDCLNNTLELQFDGDNDFVAIPPNSLFDFGANEDFTIECRVRTNTGGDVSIVGNKNWNSGLNSGFVLSFALPDGVQWKVNIGDANNRADINTGGNIIDNEWYTLSVSFDRDGFMKMFLDGVFIDQTNISEIGDINTGSGLYFGADINSSFDFSGAIAEVRVWNTVIENGTINSWYCKGIDSSHPDYGSLIGYWKLNEDSDSVALDTSIYGNDGTVTGSIWDSPNLEAYDYSETPRIVDVPYTALAHLCIPIQEDWGLDGESWIPNCDVLGVSTGVLDLEVQIFPNPVADNLNITVINIKDYKEIVLEIHTISGKKIHQQVLLNQKTIVNLFDISEGVYFLKIRTEDGFIIKKIVKTS